MALIKEYRLYITWLDNTTTTETYNVADFPDAARTARTQLREYMKLDEWLRFSIEKVFFKEDEPIPLKLIRRSRTLD